MKQTTLPIAALLGLFLTGCMQPAPTDDTDDSNTNPCVATPSLCKDGKLPVGSYNLSEFAKVSANSSFSNGRYVVQQVRDGIARVNAEYTSWLPEFNSVNNAWIRFEWTTPVEIDVIGIYDHGHSDSFVSSGEVRFYAPDDDDFILPVDFSLEESQTKGLKTDDGDMGEWVNGPGSGQKVTAMEVRVLNHVSKANILGYDLAGLNEIVIGGRRIEEGSVDVGADVNLMPYARVTAASSVKDATSHLAGPHSARRVNDGAPTEWVTAGGGANASISLEFDLAYCVKRMRLKDRADAAHRFKHATVVFNDAKVVTNATTGAKSESATDMEIIVPTDYRKDVKKITVMLDEIKGGLDTGLAEIEAYPCD